MTNCAQQAPIAKKAIVVRLLHQESNTVSALGVMSIFKVRTCTAEYVTTNALQEQPASRESVFVPRLVRQAERNVMDLASCSPPTKTTVADVESSVRVERLVSTAAANAQQAKPTAGQFIALTHKTTTETVVLAAKPVAAEKSVAKESVSKEHPHQSPAKQTRTVFMVLV